MERAPGRSSSGLGSPCHARLGEPGEAVHQPVVNAAQGGFTISIEAGGIGHRHQVEPDFVRQPVHQPAQVGEFRVAVFGHALTGSRFDTAPCILAGRRRPE